MDGADEGPVVPGGNQDRDLVRRIARGERRAQDALIAALMPSSIPMIPGLDVALHGGTRTGAWGNFADVFPAGPHYGISFGDVAGQRDGSDVFGVTAKMTLRALASRNTSPTMVMRYLNNSLIHAFERR